MPVRLRRLFLDANVLFAACRQEGRARALPKPAARAEVLLLTSPHALEEARRNLEAKRPEALVTGAALGPLLFRRAEAEAPGAAGSARPLWGPHPKRTARHWARGKRPGALRGRKRPEWPRRPSA